MYIDLDGSRLAAEGGGLRQHPRPRAESSCYCSTIINVIITYYVDHYVVLPEGVHCGSVANELDAQMRCNTSPPQSANCVYT